MHGSKNVKINFCLLCVMTSRNGRWKNPFLALNIRTQNVLYSICYNYFITEINPNTNFATYRKCSKLLKRLSKKYVNVDNRWLKMSYILSILQLKFFLIYGITFNT